jgi:hypothetical protein
VRVFQVEHVNDPEMNLADGRGIVIDEADPREPPRTAHVHFLVDLAPQR